MAGPYRSVEQEIREVQLALAGPNDSWRRDELRARLRELQRPSDAELEAAIDRRVQRRLATDREYRFAETAEQQAEREDEITRQVERELGLDEEVT